jgi:hypothetical protein
MESGGDGAIRCFSQASEPTGAWSTASAGQNLLDGSGTGASAVVMHAVLVV